jgi:hypothetical protein
LLVLYFASVHSNFDGASKFVSFEKNKDRKRIIKNKDRKRIIKNKDRKRRIKFDLFHSIPRKREIEEERGRRI